ncbi:hypothetical protein FACS1894187_09510 [Synergistales bacterium]|nr:hypothetical protein FACS1894187_09510 [Synergistales bacterium]
MEAICGLAFFVIAYPFRAMAGYLIKLPVHWLIAIIGPLAMLGIYLAKFSVDGGNLAMLIAVWGVICGIIGLPVVGVLLGMILGSVIEVDLIRAYQVGGFGRFLVPGAIILIAINVITVSIGVYKSYFAKDSGDKSKQLKMVGQGDNEEITADDNDSIQTKSQHSVGQDALFRLISGFIALSIGCTIIIASWPYAPMARVWPRIVSVTFLIVPGIVLLIMAFRHWSEIALYQKNKPKRTQKQKRNIRDSLVIFLTMLAAFNLTPYIGFIEGCILFSFGITMYMSPKKLLQNLAVTAAIFALLLAMKYGFSFLLPAGPLGL